MADQKTEGRNSYTRRSKSGDSAPRQFEGHDKAFQTTKKKSTQCLNEMRDNNLRTESPFFSSSDNDGNPPISNATRNNEIQLIKFNPTST